MYWVQLSECFSDSAPAFSFLGTLLLSCPRMRFQLISMRCELEVIVIKVLTFLSVYVSLLIVKAVDFLFRWACDGYCNGWLMVCVGITVKETSRLGPRPQKPIEIYEFEGYVCMYVCMYVLCLVYSFRLFWFLLSLDYWMNISFFHLFPVCEWSCPFCRKVTLTLSSSSSSSTST